MDRRLDEGSSSDEDDYNPLRNYTLCFGLLELDWSDEYFINCHVKSLPHFKFTIVDWSNMAKEFLKWYTSGETCAETNLEHMIKVLLLEMKVEGSPLLYNDSLQYLKDAEAKSKLERPVVDVVTCQAIEEQHQWLRGKSPWIHAVWELVEGYSTSEKNKAPLVIGLLIMYLLRSSKGESNNWKTEGLIAKDIVRHHSSYCFNTLGEHVFMTMTTPPPNSRMFTQFRLKFGKNSPSFHRILSRIYTNKMIYQGTEPLMLKNFLDDGLLSHLEGYGFCTYHWTQRAVQKTGHPIKDFLSQTLMMHDGYEMIFGINGIRRLLCVMKRKARWSWPISRLLNSRAFEYMAFKKLTNPLYLSYCVSIVTNSTSAKDDIWTRFTGLRQVDIDEGIKFANSYRRDFPYNQ